MSSRRTDNAQQPALAGFGRYAGPATLILSSLADGREARVRADQGRRVVRRGSARARHPVRGARAAGVAGPDRGARVRRPAPPLPAHGGRRGGAAGAPGRAAPGDRHRPAPPRGQLGHRVSAPAAADGDGESSRGASRRGPAAALVPEGVAGPVRRGVRRTAHVRHRRAAAARGRTLDVARGGLVARLAAVGLAASRCAPGASAGGRARRACRARDARAWARSAAASRSSLGFGAAMWSQLTIGWQWSQPAVPPPPPRRHGRHVGRPCSALLVLAAGSPPLPVLAGRRLAIAHGRPGRLLGPRRSLVMRQRVIVFAGGRHFENGWPGTGGHGRPRPRRARRVRVGDVAVGLRLLGASRRARPPSPPPSWPGWR